MASITNFDPDSFISNSSHIGWVPCVSGHLDFGLTTVGLNGGFLSSRKRDVKHETINFAFKGRPDSHVRRIALQSWVDWKDVLPGDGEFRVVVTSECSESQNLDNRYMHGQLCLYPRSYKQDHPEINSLLMTPIDKLSKIQIEFSKLKPLQKRERWPEYQKRLNEGWLELSNIISTCDKFDNTANELYFVDFYITHSGFVYLKYAPTVFDEQQPLEDDDIYVVIRQAFYYLKYSIHKHKHHTEEADALTTVVKYNDSSKNDAGTQLIGQLKRELTRIKRTQKENHRRHDDSEALGILGYMKSFLRSCKESNLLDDSNYERERDWISGMRDSFTAQHERIQTKHNRIDAAGQISRQWTGILLAYTSLTALLWVNVNRGNRERSTTSTSDSYFLFEVLEGDWNYVLVAYVFCAFFIWSVNHSIKMVKLMDDKPRLLRRLFKTSYPKFLLVWGGTLGVILSAWFYTYGKYGY